LLLKLGRRGKLFVGEKGGGGGGGGAVNDDAWVGDRPAAYAGSGSGEFWVATRFIRSRLRRSSSSSCGRCITVLWKFESILIRYYSEVCAPWLTSSRDRVIVANYGSMEVNEVK
jgi:hypothetical protein